MVDLLDLHSIQLDSEHHYKLQAHHLENCNHCFIQQVNNYHLSMQYYHFRNSFTSKLTQRRKMYNSMHLPDIGVGLR